MGVGGNERKSVGVDGSGLDWVVAQFGITRTIFAVFIIRFQFKFFSYIAIMFLDKTMVDMQ